MLAWNPARHASHPDFKLFSKCALGRRLDFDPQEALPDAAHAPLRARPDKSPRSPRSSSVPSSWLVTALACFIVPLSISCLCCV